MCAYGSYNYVWNNVQAKHIKIICELWWDWRVQGIESCKLQEVGLGFKGWELT